MCFSLAAPKSLRSTPAVFCAANLLPAVSPTKSPGFKPNAAFTSSFFSTKNLEIPPTNSPFSSTLNQYDLVCNGVELSSGAVRNHDPEIMIKAFELVGLGEDDVKAKFPAMYNAFCYGAPPHAGIAPGVDRMIMLICGEESIREIIPFPMNKNAMDVMMGAPATVEPKQLEDVHIQIKMPKED